MFGFDFCGCHVSSAMLLVGIDFSRRQSIQFPFGSLQRVLYGKVGVQVCRVSLQMDGSSHPIVPSSPVGRRKKRSIERKRRKIQSRVPSTVDFPY